MLKLIFLAILPTFVGSICPVGFTQMTSNPNKCFNYLYEVYMTAEQAINRCNSLGYSLLSIDSKEENDELIGAVINCNGPKCGSAWIGLNYNNVSDVHLWNDGYPIVFTHFNESSQYCDDGFYGKQYFLSWDGFWYNCPANSYYGKVHGALCEYRTDCPESWLQSQINTSKCFTSQTVKENFFTAVTTGCSSIIYGANLAQIFSIETNNEFLVTGTAQAMKCDKFLIDLVYQNGQWEWYSNNGQPVNATYFNWKQGYPQNLNNTCTLLNINDGTWTNVDCMSSECFLCEKSVSQVTQ